MRCKENYPMRKLAVPKRERFLMVGLFLRDMKELNVRIYPEIFKCGELTDNALRQEIDVGDQERNKGGG